MNQNALVFADSVLVPVACDYLSLVGVRQVIKTVKNVNALLHHPVQIYGVSRRSTTRAPSICREAVETLKRHFGDRCLAADPRGDQGEGGAGARADDLRVRRRVERGRGLLAVVDGSSRAASGSRSSADGPRTERDARGERVSSEQPR